MKVARVLWCVLGVAAVIAVTAPTSHADWSSAISGDAPLHWFRFDEISGDAAVDSGSAGANGTYTNGVVLGLAGLVGGAVGLDGVDDHVILGQPDLAGDWTAELIVLANGAGASQGFMGSTVAALKADQWNQTGQMGYTAFGVIDVTLGAPTPAELTHVAYVKTDAGVDVYANGALADTGTTLIDLPLDVLGGGRINPDGSVVDPLGGLLDEIVIYDRALTAGDIQGHVAAIPEPASLTLIATGALALLLLALRRRR